MSSQESQQSDDEKKWRKRAGDCLRAAGNFSKIQPYHIFDKPAAFIPELLAKEIPFASPKLQALLDKIEKLDARDMEKEGKLFKHMIFTDVAASQPGSKIIASALISAGFSLVFDKHLKISESDLEEKATDYKRFGLLMSKTIYEKSMPKKLQKKQLQIFNERDVNVYGRRMRIMLLDQGFKEGIDLYDVKYVHLFEPLVNRADEKQAIGRGTRFCGQKGLEFHPRFGWPLYVFRYELGLDGVNSLHAPRESNMKNYNNLFDLYLEYANIDMKQVVFAAELEEVVKESSVDRDLNKSMHNFRPDAPPPIFEGGATTRAGAKKVPPPPSPPTPSPSDSERSASASSSSSISSSSSSSSSRSRATSNTSSNTTDISDEMFSDEKERQKQHEQQKKWGLGLHESVSSPLQDLPSLSPKHIMGLREMHAYVKANFSHCEYKDEPMKNGCQSETETLEEKDKATVKALTHTQEFVRQFLQPQGAYKGMLLYHGVGSGKTCSGIAGASTSFEAQGYTILWVTRHTLKEDLWKNMVSDVCNSALDAAGAKAGQTAIGKDGKVKNKKRFMSKSWLPPVSYKTFSNMLLKKNKTYDFLKLRNGERDPLHKTLVIIDEAHKLYGETSAHERPDVGILEKMIDNSYRVSGEKSVRVILMTATPYTSNGLELVKLINLLRQPGDKLPTEMPAFTAKYLDAAGHFTEKGKADFSDSMSGYVSYLNRSLDARNFAHPVYEDVLVKVSASTFVERDGDLFKAKEAEAKEKLRPVKEAFKAAKVEHTAAVKECKKAFPCHKGSGKNKKSEEQLDAEKAHLEECATKARATLKPHEEKLSEAEKLFDEAKDAKVKFMAERRVFTDRVKEITISLKNIKAKAEDDLIALRATRLSNMTKQQKREFQLKERAIKLPAKNKMRDMKQERNKIKIQLQYLDEEAGRKDHRELSQMFPIRRCIGKVPSAEDSKSYANSYTNGPEIPRGPRRAAAASYSPRDKEIAGEVKELMVHLKGVLEAAIEKKKPITWKFAMLNFHPDRFPTKFKKLILANTPFQMFTSRLFEEIKYNIEGKNEARRPTVQKITVGLLDELAQNLMKGVKMGGGAHGLLGLLG